jgi:ABC-type lipoprotein export system ATPase subunit
VSDAIVNPLIELHDVSKVYEMGRRKPAVVAVSDIDLSVNEGEFAVITGRSGSGKTTLLNLVSGLTRPTTGQVLLDRTEVWRLPDVQQSQLRNRKIGFIFQFPSLMPSLTALENVILPTMAEPDPDPAATRRRAAELLVEVALADKLEAYPRQLSAGQQQRVVIARALINHPGLLLADEPTSDLDEQTEDEIMGLFQSIYRSRGITILLVTHASELVRYGTRSVRMAGGQIVADDAA